MNQVPDTHAYIFKKINSFLSELLLDIRQAGQNEA